MMQKIEIRIEPVHGAHYQWRLYIPSLDRPVCESCMAYPSYSTCVKDAIRFRKNLDAHNSRFKCLTCRGHGKVEVCDTCYDRIPQVMQKIDVHPKLTKCFNCGKGKPKMIDCPECQGGKNPPVTVPIIYETPKGKKKIV